MTIAKTAKAGGAAAVMVCLSLLSIGCSKPKAVTTQTTPAPSASASLSAPEGYKESHELPAAWPAALIPLPDGVTPVASLAPASGESITVLFSASQTPADIDAFMVRELPKKGWKILDSSPTGPSRITTAEGNGYVGVFGAGEGLGPARISTGEKVAMQVILTKSS